MLLETNDAGELLLPRELVQAPPHTALQAERRGGMVVVEALPVAVRQRRPTMRTLPTLPGRFADETSTFRREDLYGDDGR